MLTSSISSFIALTIIAFANSSPNHELYNMIEQKPLSYSDATKSIGVDGTVTLFELPTAEERAMTMDSYYLAYIQYTYAVENGLIKFGGGEIGKFGEGKILNVSGSLVHVTSPQDLHNHTGCYNRFNVKDLPNDPWIALIKRGFCNFEIKVKHAYNHGAVGVIIYNDKDSITLDKMKIDDKERDITAVFISRANGEQMVKLIDMGFKINASIIEGTKCVKPLSNVNRTSVLFVSISFIVLMVISLVWLVFYYIQRFRYLQTKDKQSRRLCNAAKRIISKIPTKSIKSDDKEIDNDCCPICIEIYKVTDVIRVLPCKHEFHKTCIDPWLLEHRTCPMCKMDILKHYGFVFTGSQESILQLDLDVEEGDIDVISISSPRRDGVSPLPQIRSEINHQHSRRSSIDTDSDRDIMSSSSPNETTPSLPKRQSIQNSARPTKNQTSKHNQPTTSKSNSNEICVGCIAAALSKQNYDTDSNLENNENDFEDDDDVNMCNSKNNKNDQNGPSSLPSTLKKFKGNHSTGSCRGIISNNQFLIKHNHGVVQSISNDSEIKLKQNDLNTVTKNDKKL